MEGLRYKVYSFGTYIGTYSEEAVMEMTGADRKNVRVYGENGNIRNGQWKIVRENLLTDEEFTAELNQWCRLIQKATIRELRAALCRMKSAAQ